MCLPLCNRLKCQGGLVGINYMNIISNGTFLYNEVSSLDPSKEDYLHYLDDILFVVKFVSYQNL